MIGTSLPNAGWSEQDLLCFFFVFLRISMVLVFAPLFGDRNMPLSVKILFSVTISVIVFGVLNQSDYFTAERIEKRLSTTSGLILFILQEGTIGAMIGYLSEWLFHSVQFGANFAAMNMGYSMATVLDPHTETQAVAAAQFHSTLAMLLFIAVDGHHVVLQAIAQSFHIIDWDLFELGKQQSVVNLFIDVGSQVLILGVKLSAPIFIITTIVNLIFGVMAKAVPQLNVMAISFAANIFVGLFVLIVATPGFLNMVSTQIDAYPRLLFDWMTIIANK